MNTAASTSLWEIRKAVKPWLADTSETILFGCSGGADSMAMALALFIEANGVKIIPVVVDHGLQDGSAEITAQTITKLKKIGYTQIESAVAQVTLTDGLEASARRARYQIFNQFIDTHQPKFFLLAHTLNDQAESVLLGLARGSGVDGLSGMASSILKEGMLWFRPLLEFHRSELRDYLNINNLKPSMSFIFKMSSLFHKLKDKRLEVSPTPTL